MRRLNVNVVDDGMYRTVCDIIFVRLLLFAECYVRLTRLEARDLQEGSVTTSVASGDRGGVASVPLAGDHDWLTLYKREHNSCVLFEYM